MIKEYINSVGRSLPRPNTLGDVYDYLTNRESMRALLVQKQFKSTKIISYDTGRPADATTSRHQIMLESKFSFISLTVAADKLYPTYVGSSAKNVTNLLRSAWSEAMTEALDVWARPY